MMMKNKFMEEKKEQNKLLAKLNIIKNFTYNEVEKTNPQHLLKKQIEHKINFAISFQNKYSNYSGMKAILDAITNINCEKIHIIGGDNALSLKAINSYLPQIMANEISKFEGQLKDTNKDKKIPADELIKITKEYFFSNKKVIDFTKLISIDNKKERTNFCLEHIKCNEKTIMTFISSSIEKMSDDILKERHLTKSDLSTLNKLILSVIKNIQMKIFEILNKWIKFNRSLFVNKDKNIDQRFSFQLASSFRTEKTFCNRKIYIESLLDSKQLSINRLLKRIIADSNQQNEQSNRMLTIDELTIFSYFGKKVLNEPVLYPVSSSKRMQLILQLIIELNKIIKVDMESQESKDKKHESGNCMYNLKLVDAILSPTYSKKILMSTKPSFFKEVDHSNKLTVPDLQLLIKLKTTTFNEFQPLITTLPKTESQREIYNLASIYFEKKLEDLKQYLLSISLVEEKLSQHRELVEDRDVFINSLITLIDECNDSIYKNKIYKAVIDNVIIKIRHKYIGNFRIAQAILPFNKDEKFIFSVPELNLLVELAVIYFQKFEPLKHAVKKKCQQSVYNFAREQLKYELEKFRDFLLFISVKKDNGSDENNNFITCRSRLTNKENEMVRNIVKLVEFNSKEKNSKSEKIMHKNYIVRLLKQIDEEYIDNSRDHRSLSCGIL